MNITALIEEMAHLAEKIKNGSADLGELEAFVASSKDVYERAIVLRYKAYENKVFGVSQLPKDEISAALANEEVKAVIPQVEEKVSNEIKAEESNDESFDLFSFDDEKTEESEVSLKVEKEVETTFEPKVEEEFPHISAVIEKIIEEEKQIPLAEPIVEKKPEPVKSTIVSTGELHSIYSKVNYSDNSLAARLNNVAIETLQGAFSLSENMQIINELFGGSHDALSDALKVLNNLSNREEARGKVSDYANQYSWKTDSEIALAFVQKIDRRYV